MAKIKLTKSAVDAAQPQAQAVELRDTLVPGFLCKITPAGRKVFMLQYRTNAGERRKPALGLYGELTVEQARALAQEWMAEVRRGGDPSTAKAAARSAPTVKELCGKFMEDYSKQRNKPSTQEGYQGVIDRNIIPMLGRMKVQDVKRPDVAAMMKKMAHKPADANRTFSVIRRMFNLAEVWGYRPDGTNPCRHVPMYPNGKATHLISDEDMGKLFRQLDRIEAEGLENYVIPLAIRLQFEFAGRRGEIVTLQWDWVDFENRRVVWPDSKTGGMSKPMSEEAYRLLSTAPRVAGCPYVLPSPNHPGQHLTTGEHYNGWSRALKAAGAAHVGTHGIRHRSATDIANSGIPVKVGMALTAHKRATLMREGSIVPREACITDRIDGLASTAVLPAAILAAMPSPRTRRTVPLECDQPVVVRQPVFRAGQHICRDRHRASGLARVPPIMIADPLYVAVHLVVPSGMSFCWPSLCRRACSVGANSAYWAPHFALPSAQPSNVQASCLERAQPAAIGAFAGALAAGAAAPPGRRCPERQRGAKAEGEIKGRGTLVCVKPVCTWGWRGTHRIAAPCRPTVPDRMNAGVIACQLRGSTPRSARTA